MKFKKAIAGLTAGVMILSACGSEGAQEAEIVYTAVETYDVSMAGIKQEMVYAGQVKASESVNIISKITSKVEEIYFEVGDDVQEGDILFRLDEKDVQDSIKQLQAALNIQNQTVATAQNSLNTVTGGQYQTNLANQELSIENYNVQIASTEMDLQNAEKAVDNARLAFENAETAYENSKALFEADAISQTALDQAELSYNQALQAYTSAQNQLESAKLAFEQLKLTKEQAEETLERTKGQITDESIRQAELAVQSASAARNSAALNLQLAQETLEDLNVTTPISGTVSVKNVRENEYASQSSVAYTIVNIDTVDIDVKISETLINSVYPGQEVEVTISTLRDEPYVGKIKTVSPAADATSTFPVTIEIENRDHEIKPGMFAEVTFIRAESTSAVVLPRNAVLEDENNTYVYVNDNSVAKKVIVETGIDNGKEIEILSGVNAGDKVITKGQTYVTDGEYINDVTAKEE